MPKKREGEVKEGVAEVEEVEEVEQQEMNKKKWYK